MAVKVTAYQQKLINQLLITPKVKDAAERIGMSYDYARKVVTKSHVIEALQKANQRVSKRAEIDSAWVLRNAVSVFKRCMQDVPVLDSGGNPTGEFRFDASGANRALESIGKHKAVDAFVRSGGQDDANAAPAGGQDGGVWTVKIVHVSKDEYERSIGNGKPPIEHQS